MIIHVCDSQKLSEPVRKALARPIIAAGSAKSTAQSPVPP